MQSFTCVMFGSSPSGMIYQNYEQANPKIKFLLQWDFCLPGINHKSIISPQQASWLEKSLMSVAQKWLQIKV